MEISKFIEKLNKVDGNVYVIEEEIHLTDGAYEAKLQHDNINEVTFAVYTGPKLTGNRLETYTLSTPSLAPWQRFVRVYADVPVVYISYETDGDTVEADDINLVQEAVVVTQKALNAEAVRAADEEEQLRDDLETEVERAKKAERNEMARAEGAEKILTDDLESEVNRAVVAEKKIADDLSAEASRAKAKEAELQSSMDAHTTTAAGEIQALKSADTTLEVKKADTAYVNTELSNRYTKNQIYTKEEVLKKIEDLIGSAPETLDTLKKIADSLGNDPDFAGTIMNALAGKIDKVSGKQLSTNDYSDAEKAIMADVDSKKHTHSNKTTLDKLTQVMLDNMSAAYTHISDGVKHITALERTNWTDAYNKCHEHGNKSILDGITQVLLDKWNSALTDLPAHTHTKSQISDMPTKLSQFTNDPGYITQSDVDISQNHSHSNKTVLDKITQALLDNWSAAYTHISNKSNPHAVTKAQVGLGSAENKSGSTIRSEMTKAEVVAALGYTPPESSVAYTHPNSGITAGTYRSVTVNAQGHATAGTNPTTLAGYGIADAAPKTHNHDSAYLKKGLLTWGDLKGV